jgi:hypothetical protein
MTTVDLGRLPRGTDGELVVGQTGKSPLWKTVSGDATLAASGALTLGAQFHRTITGIANQIAVANGDGVSGNPTISLDAAVVGAWTTYTPVITAASGTFTTVSAAGRYKQIGKTVFIFVSVTITTNGTAAGYVVATLPVNSLGNGNIIAGRESAVAGKMLQAIVGAASMIILNYDNTYPGGDGCALLMTGVYEAA